MEFRSLPFALMLFSHLAAAEPLVKCRPKPNSTGEVYKVEIQELGNKLQYVFTQESGSQSTVLKRKIVTVKSLKQSGFCRISVYPESSESFPNAFLYLDKDCDQKEWTLGGPGGIKVPDLVCEVRPSYAMENCEKAREVPVIPISPVRARSQSLKTETKRFLTSQTLFSSVNWLEKSYRSDP